RRAGASGSIRHNTATQHSRVLFTWSRRIEPSGDRLRKNANDFITFLHAPTLAPPRKGAGSSGCRAFPHLRHHHDARMPEGGATPRAQIGIDPARVRGFTLPGPTTSGPAARAEYSSGSA